MNNFYYTDNNVCSFGPFKLTRIISNSDNDWFMYRKKCYTLTSSNSYSGNIYELTTKTGKKTYHTNFELLEKPKQELSKYNEQLGAFVEQINDSIKTTKQEYTIRWDNTYEKSKGLAKELWQRRPTHYISYVCSSKDANTITHKLLQLPGFERTRLIDARPMQYKYEELRRVEDSNSNRPMLDLVVSDLYTGELTDYIVADYDDKRTLQENRIQFKMDMLRLINTLPRIVVSNTKNQYYAYTWQVSLTDKQLLELFDVQNDIFKQDRCGRWTVERRTKVMSRVNIDVRRDVDRYNNLNNNTSINDCTTILSIHKHEYIIGFSNNYLKMTENKVNKQFTEFISRIYNIQL